MACLTPVRHVLSYVTSLTRPPSLELVLMRIPLLSLLTFPALSTPLMVLFSTRMLLTPSWVSLPIEMPCVP